MYKTEEEWRKILTKEEFEILRKKGTERAFTGKNDQKLLEEQLKKKAKESSVPNQI